ncbi:MAG: hypothetical protein Q9167_003346 [Letrouitia subvulpina]
MALPDTLLVVPTDFKSSISADNEWSPLRSVIVGRAENSCFPDEPEHMIKATMPEDYWDQCKPFNTFPSSVLRAACQELDHFAAILEKENVRIYRPKTVRWDNIGGYSGAMPRDGLMVVGNTIIEACFSWRCRKKEIQQAYNCILDEFEKDPSVRVVRAPKVQSPDPIYDECKHLSGWATNNSRPAFDAADFLRFGKTVLGQFSNVTNMEGVKYLRKVVPPGYSVEIVQTTDPHAMHIDATIVPLRKGLLIYNPERVTEAALRRHKVLSEWDMHACPVKSTPRLSPPLYMTSSWIFLNILSLDEKRVVVEAEDIEFAQWLQTLGMEPIFCPFRHVNSIGGSFHCATVDLIRSD